MQINIKPLSKTTWPDFEMLFGEKGACGGCWCMTPRLSSKEYEEKKGEGNRLAMQELVEKKVPVGILAYVERTPIGWCSVCPRTQLTRLQNSRIFQQIDDLPVWSISCIFINKANRRMGISAQLIKGAIAYAVQNGARILEAYPHDPISSKMPDVFAYAGFMSAFIENGFVEVARNSDHRPIMRYNLNPIDN